MLALYENQDERESEGGSQLDNAAKIPIHIVLGLSDQACKLCSDLGSYSTPTIEWRTL
jgi:hypothetical protein